MSVVIEPSSAAPAEPTTVGRADHRALSELMLRCMEQAVEAAISDHHLHGQPVVIMNDDDQMLWLHPDGSYTPVEEGPTDTPAGAGS